MKIKRSIERKVFFIFGGFTLLVGLTFSLVSLITAFSIEDSILEKVLAHEAKVIALEYKTKNSKPSARLDYMTFYSELANAPTDIVKAKIKNPQITEVFSDSNHHYHVVDVMLNQKQVGWLVADVTEFLTVSSQSSYLLPVAIFLLTLAIAFSLWLAYRIALRTTRPISNLANALEKQIEGDSELDISEFKTGDEIEYLARTTESALKELKASLQRESDFNRDVSHELRTPLTIIKNTLALAEQRQLNHEEQSKLNYNVEQISHIVKTLLALARAETFVFDKVNLRSIVEDSVLSFEQKQHETGVEIHLDISEQVNVTGNNELILLLCNNLIENAIKYSANKHLSITLNHNQLVFSNQHDPQRLQNQKISLLEPNVKQQGSEGIGQGLYLVSRIVKSLGWSIRIRLLDDTYQVSLGVK